jgi:uncharacterized protein (DUF488 family)
VKHGDVIFTVGHSTRTVADLVALLREAEVSLLVDVRSFPRSRTTPQFNGDTLPGSLAAAGIGYRHLRALGGRRQHPKGAPPSLNGYWRVDAFRSYADYAETEECFRAHVATDPWIEDMGGGGSEGTPVRPRLAVRRWPHSLDRRFM